MNKSWCTGEHVLVLMHLHWCSRCSAPCHVGEILSYKLRDVLSYVMRTSRMLTWYLMILVDTLINLDGIHMYVFPCCCPFWPLPYSLCLQNWRKSSRITSSGCRSSAWSWMSWRKTLLWCGMTSGNKCRSTVTVCEGDTVPCLPFAAAVVQSRVLVDAVTGREKPHHTWKPSVPPFFPWYIKFYTLPVKC